MLRLGEADSGNDSVSREEKFILFKKVLLILEESGVQNCRDEFLYSGSQSMMNGRQISRPCDPQRVQIMLSEKER